MSDSNWLWKPPHGVAAQIERGNKHFDPLRKRKLAKRAEAVGYRMQRDDESNDSYEMALQQCEKINKHMGRA